MSIGNMRHGRQAPGVRDVEVSAAIGLARIMTEMASLRSDSGMTQKQLADAVGVSQAGVSHMEHMRGHMRLDTALRVLAAFGKTLAVVGEADVGEVPLG